MRQLAGTKTTYHWAHAASLARLISGRGESNDAKEHVILGHLLLTARDAHEIRHCALGVVLLGVCFRRSLRSLLT
jgi:hypothetical protein